MTQQDERTFETVDGNGVPGIVTEISNAPDSIETAVKSKKSGKIAKAKQAVAKGESKAAKTEPKQEFIMYVADGETTAIALSDIVPLDNTPIENAVLAMRELDKRHVEHIKVAIEQGEEMPPIDVVATNIGHIPYDGYHRVAAYEMFLRETLEENAPDGNVNPDDFLKARQQFFVPAREHTFTSERDLLKASFEANLRHGLPASESSRSRYGLWIYAENRAMGTPISLRKAADMAHCSHVALIKMRDRIDASKKKMIDTTLTAEDEQELAEIETQEENKEGQKVLNTAEKHMKAVVKAVDWFSEQDFTRSEVQSFVGAYAKDLTKEQILEMKSLLDYFYESAPNGPTPEQKELLNVK